MRLYVGNRTLKASQPKTHKKKLNSKERSKDTVGQYFAKKYKFPKAEPNCCIRSICWNFSSFLQCTGYEPEYWRENVVKRAGITKMDTGCIRGCVEGPLSEYYTRARGLFDKAQHVVAGLLSYCPTRLRFKRLQHSPLRLLFVTVAPEARSTPPAPYL